MKNKLLNLLLSLTLIVGVLSSPALAQPQSLPESVSTLPESVSSFGLEALPTWARARPPATSALRYLPLFIPGAWPLESPAAAGLREIESISDSTVTSSGACYQPDVVLTFCFSAYNASLDLEWLDEVGLTFPAGWTAACNSQDASDSGENAVSLDCAANANSVIYSDDDDGWGEIYDGESWGFCVDVAAPGGAAGSQTASWSLSGDNYGAGPHDLTGALALEQCSLPQWDKLIDGAPWTPGSQLTRETSDTLTVTDVLSAHQDVQLFEQWNADELALISYTIAPPGAGNVNSSDEGLTWTLTGGGPFTLTKSFRVEPSSWTMTILSETLQVEEQPYETRPVTIAKWLPNLWIDSVYDPAIYVGGVGMFTLLYSNTGGYENDVWIRNTFPSTTPFLWSDPPPDDLDSFPQQVGWDVGDLSAGERGSIDVYVAVVADSGEIWDYIYDHAGQEQGSTMIEFHVTGPPLTWDKRVDGEPWGSGERVTVQTSDTIQVVDTVIASNFVLTETWNTDEIYLTEYQVLPPGNITVITDAGTLRWDMPSSGVLLKRFHVEPGAWTKTIIQEELVVGSNPPVHRPYPIEKLSPELWINSSYVSDVQPGQDAIFTLNYGNNGGYQNDVMLRNEFPPEAPFVAATPSPDRSAPDGSWVEWDVGDLPQDDSGSIEVTVAITGSLLPSNTVEIWDYIYDHVRVEQDSVVTSFHRPFPPTAWTKTINGQQNWTPGIAVTAQASDTISVADAITTAAAFELVETWDPTALEFLDYIPSLKGTVIVGNGVLTWTAPAGEEVLATIIKNFHVQPCTWTTSLVGEELWVEGGQFDARPLTITKQPPALWLTSQYESDVTAGELATFTLVYSNTGGREYGAWIRNDFPPQAPFMWATPGPVTSDDSQAQWNLGELSSGAQGRITVTVALTANLLPSTTIEIRDYIYDHAGVEQDDAIITFTPYPFTWTETVNGQPLAALISLTLQTADAIVVVDVITTTGAPLELFERWHSAHLELQNYWLSPGFSGDLSQGEGALTLTIASGVSQIITLTRLFHLQPCTWTQSLLKQDLWVGGQLHAKRGVIINKRLPELWISSDAAYNYAYAGETSVFTLRYGNRGGRESAVMIRSDLNSDALLAQALPAPTRVATDATWAEWDVGTLAGGASQNITVAVLLSAGLSVSNSVEIGNHIYDHAGMEQGSISITFHVTETPPLTWYKQANDAPWSLDLNVAVETADPLEIVDVFDPTGAPYTLTEQWDPAHLALSKWTLEPPSAGDVSTTTTGSLALSVVNPAETVTLTKLFLVQPCTWTETAVREQSWYEGYPQALQRPVFINKLAPDLWLDSDYTVVVTSGRAATFTLNYGNAGGYESAAWIENLFPPQALFESSNPPPDDANPDGSWAVWNLGALAMDQQGSVLVTVTIGAGLPASTTVPIWDGIYNHAGELMDQITSTYYTTPPLCAWVHIDDVLAAPNGCVVDLEPLYSGDPPITWTWNFMGGAPASSNLEKPSVDFGSSGYYPYTLDAANCGGDGQDDYSGSVTVNCAPACTAIAAAYLDYSPAAPSVGQAITFSGSISPSSATPPITYTWSFGGVGPTVIHTFPLTTATQVYSVSVTASNTCPSEATVNTAVTVYAHSLYLPLVIKN